MSLPDLSHLAHSNTLIRVRVTPKAAANRIDTDDTGALRIYVTPAPTDGKATTAVQKLLAKAMGIARTRLVLQHGAHSRDKVFRVE
ncbi:DUF167 domain-containing protein [Puniceibacterium sp. IMCC21224]|uniref:DUF167 domain-containing protein n=1 Tax=Puniceibacterium sp. IMCC21224 TaxID=1618204 RepID=UPI00064DCB9E|nr:DUF167 domain-containing protein [Puniceibacterium sp. IMCC21224]KMK65790.1 hypothetical protein IMCC21224_11626 [Puniceibacterium sp. IMCC21224]